MTALPAILDLEASGFGRNSYPIEVGWVMGDGRSHCSLIRPAAHWTHWDPAAEQVHRIDRATLLQHGRSAHEVAAQLNHQLHGLTVYSDGWAHDYPWLAMLFDEAGLHPTFRLDSLRRLLSEAEAAAWHDTRRTVAAQLGSPRHRASADARLLQMTLRQLRSTTALDAV